MNCTIWRAKCRKQVFRVGNVIVVVILGLVVLEEYLLLVLDVVAPIGMNLEGDNYVLDTTKK